MNIQTLVVVVLRLMALDFLYRSALELASGLISFSVRLHLRSTDLSPWILFVWLALIAVFIVAAVLLWFLAPAIARLVSRGVPQDISLGILSLADCYSVAFMGVGLMFIGSRVPQAITWAHYLLRTTVSNSTELWNQQLKWYDVVQVAIGLTIGIVLFVNGRNWAVALARRDTAKSAPVPPENESSQNAA